MSAVADKLREARALIAQGWTQEAYSRNAEGVDLEDCDYEFEDDKPVCWCMAGALVEVNLYEDDSIVQRAIGTPSIIDWNDAPGRTQAEVLAAFDKAIALAESEAA